MKKLKSDGTVYLNELLDDLSKRIDVEILKQIEESAGMLCEENFVELRVHIKHQIEALKAALSNNSISVIIDDKVKAYLEGK